MRFAKPSKKDIFPIMEQKTISDREEVIYLSKDDAVGGHYTSFIFATETGPCAIREALELF